MQLEWSSYSYTFRFFLYLASKASLVRYYITDRLFLTQNLNCLKQKADQNGQNTAIY